MKIKKLRRTTLNLNEDVRKQLMQIKLDYGFENMSKTIQFLIIKAKKTDTYKKKYLNVFNGKNTLGLETNLSEVKKK